MGEHVGEVGPREYNVCGSGGVRCFRLFLWQFLPSGHAGRMGDVTTYTSHFLIIIIYFILFNVVNEIDETVRLRIHFWILN